MAPEFLYKYRSLANEQREFTRDIILNRRLWCGSATRLNDPFDCYPIPFLGGDKTIKAIRIRSLLRHVNPNLPRADIRKAADAILNGPPGYLDNLMREAVELTRAPIGILSLSASGSIVEMWETYCEGHQGICLRFRDPADVPHMFSLAQRVEYVAERPRIRAIDRPSPAFTKAFLLTKTDNWAYEQEWRLVDPTTTGAVSFPPAALEAIIFGSAISNPDREEVADWAKAGDSDVKLFQASFADGQVTIAPHLN